MILLKLGWRLDLKFGKYFKILNIGRMDETVD
jgi:hypothetical protein